MKPGAIRYVDLSQSPNTNGNLAVKTGTCYFKLNCPCDFLVVAASASQAGAGDCLLTVGVGVEYTTTNMWLETSTPVIAKQAFELGIASLREVEQFYENPIHIPSLMDAISNGMSAMAPLVGFIPTIGPALAAGAATGSQVIRGLKNAIYGNNGNEGEEAENRAMKRKEKNIERAAQLESVIATGSGYRRRTRRRMA